MCNNQIINGNGNGVNIQKKANDGSKRRRGESDQMANGGVWRDDESKQK